MIITSGLLYNTAINVQDVLSMGYQPDRVDGAGRKKFDAADASSPSL